MDDQKLERIAGRLGRRAAADLDVELVAQGVLGRLRDAASAERLTAGRPRPLVRWLASAAAVALLVAGAAVTFRTPQAAPDGAGQLAIGLYDLSSDELTEVLDSLSWSAPVSAQVATGLDDLDAEQLRELLALLEG